MINKKIILASASPRRNQLLKSLNIEFEVIPSQVEENIDEEDFSFKLIEKLALEKAQDVAEKINYPAIVIGADTVVVIDNHILGKPTDKENAFQMLKLLSGRTHKVISAIALIDNSLNKSITDHVVSEVTFRNLTDSEIRSYIETGEPMDKAGAYAIQGLASKFISSISGCYNNIVGISTDKLTKMLKKSGINI
ncbi:MAG: Maf family protein [Candidatus Gastranaerophilales bacterium]|nr:Maf family protein [Candidatus Gastranaerophilales bacterium]